MIGRSCNICGGTTLIPRGKRGNMICADCRSDGRSRLTWLILQSRNLLRPGLRCLHLAPEMALAPRLRTLLGDGYDPVDIAPELFPHAPGIRHFDLVRDAPSLPGGALGRGRRSSTAGAPVRVRCPSPHCATRRYRRA